MGEQIIVENNVSYTVSGHKKIEERQN